MIIDRKISSWKIVEVITLLGRGRVVRPPLDRSSSVDKSSKKLSGSENSEVPAVSKLEIMILAICFP